MNETSGSRVASNRAIQWGEQIVKPSFEQKDDYQVLYLLSKKLGLADWMFKNIAVEGDRLNRGQRDLERPRHVARPP